jgi:hypothetical protein
VVHLRPIIVSEKLGNSTDEDTTETMDELSDMSDTTELEDSGKLARIKEKRREAASLPVDMRPVEMQAAKDHKRTLSLDKLKVRA